MQVAHPLVARGVAEHSADRRYRAGRLLRTLRPMFAIVFGTADEVRSAVRRVNTVHRGVAGTGYSARDPELLLWVHATLVVDTALECYRRFVRLLRARAGGALLRGDEARRAAARRAAGAAAGGPRCVLRVPRRRGRQPGGERDGARDRARAAPAGAAVRAADGAVARGSRRGCCRRGCASSTAWPGTPRARLCCRVRPRSAGGSGHACRARCGDRRRCCCRPRRGRATRGSRGAGRAGRQRRCPARRTR